MRLENFSGGRPSLSDRVVPLNGGQIEQMGAPRELYSAPRTRFAASFMGSTNILEVDLESEGRGSCAAMGDGRLLPVGDIGRKGASTIMFRQEDVTLLPPGEDPALNATVETRIFLGSRIRYVLDYGAHQIRCLAGADTLYDVGETVGISIPQDRIRILAD